MSIYMGLTELTRVGPTLLYYLFLFTFMSVRRGYYRGLDTFTFMINKFCSLVSDLGLGI
jgi:hypothetical protein